MAPSVSSILKGARQGRCEGLHTREVKAFAAPTSWVSWATATLGAKLTVKSRPSRGNILTVELPAEQVRSWKSSLASSRRTAPGLPPLNHPGGMSSSMPTTLEVAWMLVGSRVVLLVEMKATSSS